MPLQPTEALGKDMDTKGNDSNLLRVFIRASLTSAQTRGNSHSAKVIFTRFMPPETRITYRFSWQVNRTITNTQQAWMMAQ